MAGAQVISVTETSALIAWYYLGADIVTRFKVEASSSNFTTHLPTAHALDADGNVYITEEEFLVYARSVDRFVEFDYDHNGKWSQNEFTEWSNSFGGSGLFVNADVDDDGFVSFSEYTNLFIMFGSGTSTDSMSATFQHFDTNQDGTWINDEYVAFAAAFAASVASDNEVLAKFPLDHGTETLNITGLKQGTRYVFRIRAGNLHASDFKETEATYSAAYMPVALPQTVADLEVIALGATLVTLSWTDPPGAPPTMYEVRLSVANRGFTAIYDKIVMPTVVAAGEMRFIQGMPAARTPTGQSTGGARNAVSVTNLERGARHRFRVHARNLNEQGYEVRGSNVVESYLQMQPPPAKNLKLLETTDTSVEVGWEAESFPRIGEFIVRWWISGAVDFGVAQEKSVGEAKRSANVSGLVAGNKVAIAILPKNWNTFSADGLEGAATIIAASASVPGVVTSLRPIAVDSSSVTLQFNEEDFGSATKYIVQIKRSEQADWRDFKEVSCRELSIEPINCPTVFIIDNLQQGISYDMVVLLTNQNADPPLRPIPVRVIPVNIPSLGVTNLRVIALTTESVTIAFNIPTGIDQPFAFKVIWSCDGWSTESTSNEITETIYTVVGLALNMQCRVTVIGRNLNTLGYTSAKRALPIIITASDVPTEPLAIQPVSVTVQSVTISWKPPMTGNPVTEYKVECANRTNAGEVPVFYVAGYSPGITRQLRVISRTSIPHEPFTLYENSPMLFKVSARNLNSAGFGKAGVGSGVPVNAPFASVDNFKVTAVGNDSIVLGWDTPRFGLVTEYRVKVCVAADYCSGGNYMAHSQCSSLCTCINDGTPSCGDGSEADCTCLPPNTYAPCALDSECLGDGVCLRVCGCHDCSSLTRPASPTTGQLFYDNVGAEYIYDGQEWLPTGKINWRFIANLPVRMSSLHVRDAATVILGKERTGPLLQGLRHDFSIEARNLNEIGYGTRVVFRGAKPIFLPATPIQVFAIKPQATSCLVLWYKGNDAPLFGPTTFFRIQVINTKTNHKYLDPMVHLESGTSAVIKNLSPGTSYSFKVFAGNLAGLDLLGGGNNTVQTLPYPSNIGVNRIDTSDSCGVQCNGCVYRPGCTITMFWDAVENQDQLEYKVTMRLLGAFGDPWLVKASEVRGNMVALTDFGPADTLYDVCVYGRIVGQFSYSPSCTMATVSINSAPSHAVMNLRVDNMTATELRLSWRVLDQYDDITLRNTWYALERSEDGFAPDNTGLQNTVQIRSIHHPSIDLPWFVTEAGANVVENYLPDKPILYPAVPCYYDTRFNCIYTTITGLNVGERLNYRVRARNANVAGLSTSAAYLSTAPHPRPPSARNLRVANVTDTSVLLEWQPPVGAIGTSIILNEITWSPGGRLEVDGSPITIGYNEVLKTLDGACHEGNCWFNATGLTKSRTYTFHIRLNNNHETGYEPGIPIQGSPVGVPDEPSQLFIASVTEASVHVRWRPPHGIPYTNQPGAREAIKYRLRCRLMPGYSAPNLTTCNNETFFEDSGVEVEASQALGDGIPKVLHPYAATIHGLEPGVGYRVQVCSGGLNVGYGTRYFENGCGPFVEAVTSSPPSPVSLSTPGVQATSVSLSWTSATPPTIPTGQPPTDKDLGWNFLEGMDVADYTLTCPGGANVASLKALCMARSDCAGFNTFGCLKSRIPKLWLSINQGKERQEWLLMNDIPHLLSTKAATASAAGFAQSSLAAAYAMPAAAADLAKAAAKHAVTSAGAAAAAEDAAQYLSSTPLQTHANGTCCVGNPILNGIGTMTYAGWTATPGCKRAWSDLPPQRAACGCRCMGTWYKTIMYRVQYQSSRNSPFVNVPRAEYLSQQTFLVTGLTTAQEYGFRVFAEGLNSEGPDPTGSNILFARPLKVPSMPLAVTLVSTYRSGELATVGTAKIFWREIDEAGQSYRSITSYKVQISLDGDTYINTLSYQAQGSTYAVGLPEVPSSAALLEADSINTIVEDIAGNYRVTTVTVVVENLLLGQTYWLRVLARNTNLAAYSQSPPSNSIKLIMSGAPPAVLNLKASLVTVCMSLSCGCACCGGGGTNTCDGLADVTVQWNNPSGFFSISSFQISALSAGFVAVEGEKLPTPEGGGDGSFTLAVDGSAIPSAITEEYVVRGLYLHRKYSVSVRARNANVEGYKFQSTIEILPADLPSVSVEETLKATSATASVIHLEWRPVVSQPVSFYKVDYALSPAFPTLGSQSFFGEFAHESSTDPLHRMRVSVTELTHGLAYYFLVTPRNLNAGTDGAFVPGYRTCQTSVNNLVVTSIQPPSAYSSFLAFRLTWTMPTSSVPIRRYRIWHAPTLIGGGGHVAVYQRLADFDSSVDTTMTHEIDGFSSTQSPHYFLVTPVLSHCAVLGPILARSVEQIPELASILSVTTNSVTLQWRSPGCPDACGAVSAFLISVAKCTMTAHVHTHASSMLDCNISGTESTTPMAPGSCRFDGWCQHTIYVLADRVPIKIRIQVWTEGYVEPGENVTLIGVPSGPAQRAPSQLMLVSKNNLAGDSRGASVLLTWNAAVLAVSDAPVDRYKIGYWLASEKSCFALPALPCFSYQESFPPLHTINGTVTGLRTDVSYAFTVFSGNLNGFEVEGSDTLTPIHTSHMPGPVQRLSASSPTNSSMMLSWVNPSHPTPHKLLIEVTDVDCEATESSLKASAASIVTSCVRSWEESCTIGKCTAAPSFCVGIHAVSSCSSDFEYFDRFFFCDYSPSLLTLCLFFFQVAFLWTNHSHTHTHTHKNTHT